MEKELDRVRPVRGTDFYGADGDFRLLLDVLCDPSERVGLEERLIAFSAKVSDRWDQLAEEAALNYDGPKLEPYDRCGNHVERVWLPPPIQTLRREVVSAGIFDNRTQLEQLAKVYLLAHLGETGVVCPLACTEGLIRVIRAVGSDFLKSVYLIKLLSTEIPLGGAQFITEKDMGSDVGALVTEAIPAEEGMWRLHGEKWFCSAIDEFFLIAARPQGAPEGTEGVAIFLVPRTIDGSPNGLHIKRLKEKIGTKELPTAEIDLNGSLAYNIGPIENGFKNLMNYAINTSRIMNAASGCGVMARARLEAENYTNQRSAFGQKISNYPLVQESLTKINATLSARRTLFFHLVSQFDQNPVEDLNSDEGLWQRFLINLCKYRTAIGATACTYETILLLGGNGTVETFSVLPRLYRDSIVLESWEGSHNTLALQVCRDGLRFPFREVFEVKLAHQIEQIRTGHDGETADWLENEWAKVAPVFTRLADEKWVSRQARHLLDRFGGLLETAFLATIITQRFGADSSQAGLLKWYREEQTRSWTPLS